MRSFFLALLFVACPLTALGQASGKKAPLPPHPNEPASQEVQTETVTAPERAPAVTSTSTVSVGHLDPTQVKALLHKLWLAQFRLNDLLTQVRPDNWKMPAATRQSFGQSLDSLRQALAAEEDWRGQFDTRPDSLYLGFQTYVAISAVLPRVDGVARSVSQYENPSFGGQYSQAANQLFDLQQALEPHLAALLKNQDDYLLVAQTNVAACESELNNAERGKEGKATPMKNIAPEFKGGHRRTAATPAPAANAKPAAGSKPAANTKPAAPKGKPAAKPAANPPNRTQKK
jgi:hypothetical protein